VGYREGNTSIPELFIFRRISSIYLQHYIDSHEHGCFCTLSAPIFQSKSGAVRRAQKESAAVWCPETGTSPDKVGAAEYTIGIASQEAVQTTRSPFIVSTTDFADFADFFFVIPGKPDTAGSEECLQHKLPCYPRPDPPATRKQT